MESNTISRRLRYFPFLEKLAPGLGRDFRARNQSESELSVEKEPSAEGNLGAVMTIGCRKLHLIGTHARYMREFDNLDAGESALAAIVRDLPPNATILDVGAHIGVTALTMGATRPDCSIVAFEPIPASANCLRQNVETNKLTNIRVENTAISDSSGEILLTDNGPWSTAASGASFRSRAFRLDDYVANDPLLAESKIRLVKLDVEGHEPNVLVGMRRILSEQSPLIFLEFNTWALLLHHYDPVAYATNLLSAFDVLATFSHEKHMPPPPDAVTLVHTNMMRDGCVTDLLLRPRAELPNLAAMTTFTG